MYYTIYEHTSWYMKSNYFVLFFGGIKMLLLNSYILYCLLKLVSRRPGQVLVLDNLGWSFTPDKLPWHLLQSATSCWSRRRRSTPEMKSRFCNPKLCLTLLGMICCLQQVSFICEDPGTTPEEEEEAWIQSKFSFDVKLVKPSLEDNNTHIGRKEEKGKEIKYIVITNKISK